MSELLLEQFLTHSVFPDSRLQLLGGNGKRFLHVDRRGMNISTRLNCGQSF